MASIEKLDHDKVVVYRDWVPEELFTQVQAALHQQQTRKRVYLLHDPSLPEVFHDLNTFISLRLRIGATVLIGKRYDSNDKHVSRAYTMHLDPPQWHRQDLLTLTTDGEADMFFIDSESERQEIDLQPNTFVRMKPDVMHAVSPPRSDMPRQSLFLGRSALG